MLPPANAVINVKTAYGAWGDGIHDDTIPIRNAIQAHVGTRATLFFPNGTYLVSDRLDWKDAAGTWKTYLSIQGESRAGTRIKLANNSPGYNDPAIPKPIFYTANKLGGQYGNTAFANNFYDLTIEISAGNAGAIAIDYIAHNQGSIKNVTVNALGPAHTGLALSRDYPGPCLLKNVSVNGFQYGIRVTAASARPRYSVTMEDITLTNQTVNGIYVNANAIFVRRLTSQNTVTAIRNNAAALDVLVDCSFTGGAAGNSAIATIATTEAQVYARGVTVSGYSYSLNQLGVNALAGEYKSSAALKAWTDSTDGQLQLPIEETPVVPYDTNMSNWASVQSYMTNPEVEAGDWYSDTAAVQAAMNSGKSTIYFPNKKPSGANTQYWIGGPVTVPATVKRIIGFGSVVGVNMNGYQDAANPAPVFRLIGSGADPLVAERWDGGSGCGSGPANAAIWFVNETARPLVLQQLMLGAGMAYRSTPSSGKLFIEDVCATNWQLLHTGQKVFARQINPEGSGTPPKITNAGADLWMLGLKTENISTVLHASNNSRTELLGGFLMPAHPVAAGTPGIILTDAKFSGTFISQADVGPGNTYPITVRETRGGITHDLTYAYTPNWLLNTTLYFSKIACLYSGVPGTSQPPSGLVDQNFDSTPNGTVPAPFTSGGAYGAQSTVFYGPGGKSVRLDDPTAGDWSGPGLYCSWNSLSGNMTVQWKFRVPVSGANIKQYRIRLGATEAASPVILQLSANGSIGVFPNSAGAGWTAQAGGSWVQNQWHTVRFDFNLVSNRFSYKFDGTQLITDNIYRSGSSTAITNWVAYPMVATTPGAALYLDDFFVGQ